MRHRFFDRLLHVHEDMRPTTPETFVERLLQVTRGLVERQAQGYDQPAIGRTPWPADVEIRQWWQTLDEGQRECVRYVMKQTAHAVLFNTLTVLDGVTTLEPMGEKGRFELRFVRDGESHLITDDKSPMLHDCLNTIEPGE